MLNCFDVRLVSVGEAVVAACADDIGMAVKSIELLPLAAEIFDPIERLTRLALKPAKCFTLPWSRCPIYSAARICTEGARCDYFPT